MTVKELIAELETCEPGAEVCLGDGHKYHIDLTDVYTPVPELVQLLGRLCRHIEEDKVVAALTDTRRVDERRALACGGKPENAGPGSPARCTTIIEDDLPKITKEWFDKGLKLMNHAFCHPEIPGGILREAARIRGGERNADYGDAVENFRRITEIANAITGLELTPAQCCKVMIAVKLARELHNHKRDNLVDLCGYADILQLIETSKTVGDENI